MILAEITKDNKIQINDLQNPVGDGVLFETIKFTFPLSWNGYSKTAVFKTEDKTVNIVMSRENEMCLSDSECYIPHEVLEGEEFELTVFGVKGDSIATAEKINIRVLESGFSLGDAPLNPTPSEYQQIINLTQTAVDIAQSVRNDADAGLFDGESGADIKIDQIYNPKSENAQSGVALASALENCLTADCNTEWVFDGGNASVDINFIIDDEISDTSSNAIANRAVKEYVDNNIETVAKEYLNNIKTAVSECVAEDLNAVNERITGIVNRVEAEADYIVEQGTDGIWTYRKWASGIAECWGTTEPKNISISNPWGTLYTLDNAFESYPYPFEFAKSPTVTALPETQNGNFWIFTGSGGNTIQTPTINAVRPTVYDIVGAKINYYVTGIIKEV